MGFKKRFSKKEQRRLERIKTKEDLLKTLNSSISFLESQYNDLKEKGLSAEEYYFQKKFLSEKLDVCKKRQEICKSELKRLKGEFN